MARAYCSTEDVKQYLPPNIVSEGENPVPNFRNPAPETAKNVDIEFFAQLHSLRPLCDRGTPKELMNASVLSRFRFCTSADLRMLGIPAVNLLNETWITTSFEVFILFRAVTSRVPGCDITRMPKSLGLRFAECIIRMSRLNSSTTSARCEYQSWTSSVIHILQRSAYPVL